MILSKLNQNIKALAVCTGLFSLAACREHSISKGGLVPDVDNINTFARSASDFNISFTNGTVDSLVTSNFLFSSNGTTSDAVQAVAIGAYTDPFFGTTEAIAHFQMTTYGSGFKFVPNTSMDSVILVLPYITGSIKGAYYGDTNGVAYWNIYQTGAALAKTSTYYSDDVTSLGAQIGTAAVTYQQFKDSSTQVIAAQNDTTRGQLRIKLSNSFAQDLFNADTSVFASTTAFQSFFKGISIAPDMSKPQNLMAYFFLPSQVSDHKSLSMARLECHYHSADSAYISSMVMRTPVCAYYSNIVRQFSGYPVANMFNRNTDSILIQSQPGTETSITIDNLQNIPLSIVNKAELVITVQRAGTSPNYLDYLKPPSLLVPVIVDEHGKEQPLFERIDNSGSTNNAGVLMVNPYVDSTDINGIAYQQYRINIPRTIQQYVTDRKNKITIRLKGANYFPGMDRVLAKGLTGVNDGTNFQFNVIYTKK